MQTFKSSWNSLQIRTWNYKSKSDHFLLIIISTILNVFYKVAWFWCVCAEFFLKKLTHSRHLLFELNSSYNSISLFWCFGVFWPSSTSDKCKNFRFFSNFSLFFASVSLLHPFKKRKNSFIHLWDTITAAKIKNTLT